MPWLKLEQGSEAWLSARRGMVTGSRFKDARDCATGLNPQQTTFVTLVREGKSVADAAAGAGYKKPPTSDAVAAAVKGGITMQWGGKAIDYARDLARERIGGLAPSKFVNAAMRTGTEQEPVARAMYEAETGHMVDEAGFYVSDDGVFGLSPDGLIDEDGVLEVKTLVSSDTLFTVLVDGDLSAYRDQCLGYLWLLGRQWVDLCLWVPDLANAGRKGLHIIRINRDEDEIEKLEADLMKFAVLVDEFETKLRLKAA